MLHVFLKEHSAEILHLTEEKALLLAGTRPSSEQLKKGLPHFYEQLMQFLAREEELNNSLPDPPGNSDQMRATAETNDEPAMTRATGRPEEAEMAEAAGLHGAELLHLGYTLSHVVHAYGAMCQSITQLATRLNFNIQAGEFHDLNRCLDVAIAGAVTSFQEGKNIQTNTREVERLGFLAHELRNSLNSVNLSFQLIKKGTVGPSGNTGKVLEAGLKRLTDLIDRSLTEVRLRVDPEVLVHTFDLADILDPILVTAEVEAAERDQSIRLDLGPQLSIHADQQLVHSALSNLIQNALKYTHAKGIIQIRAKRMEATIQIEVEDECGGLKGTSEDLFEAFGQRNEDRKGLGLGLSIAQKAIQLNQGSIKVQDLPGSGCIFTLTLPAGKKNE